MNKTKTTLEIRLERKHMGIQKRLTLIKNAAKSEKRESVITWMQEILELRDRKAVDAICFHCRTGLAVCRSMGGGWAHRLINPDRTEACPASPLHTLNYNWRTK